MVPWCKRRPRSPRRTAARVTHPSTRRHQPPACVSCALDLSPRHVQLQMLPQLRAGIYSNDPKTVLECVSQFRKLLSIGARQCLL